MKSDRNVLDCLGKVCPQPIIDLASFIRNMESGQIITLLSDDPATWLDLQAWGRMTSHTVVQLENNRFNILL